MESLIESAIKHSKKLPEEWDVNSSEKIRISVIGLGGAGCNTITRLSKMGIKSAGTIAINTDLAHLKIVEADKKILIGQNITRGLGAGGFPEIAQKCAEVSKDKLREVLASSELVFLCAGMGGGTGTGAAPVIADIAKEQGAIVVAMVTYPFNLERARLQKAEWGINELKRACDTVVIIDNNRLMSYVPNLPMNQAFAVADELVARAIKGISDTIMLPSLINIDFADVRSIMRGAGIAMISVGEGKGADKVNQSVKSVLKHPLLDVDCTGAKGALIHIAGGPELTLGEATEIGEKLTEVFDPSAEVVWGARLTPDYSDSVMVTAILTGIASPYIRGKEEKVSDKEMALEILEQIKY